MTDAEMRARGLDQDDRGVWVDAAKRAKDSGRLKALADRTRQSRRGAYVQAERAPKRARVGKDATLGVEAPNRPNVGRAA